MLSSNSVTLTQLNMASIPDDKIENFVQRAHRFKGYYEFLPDDLEQATKYIKPGAYTFLQNKDKKVFLIPLIEGQSAHTFLAQLIKLRVEDTLSAGEMAIDTNKFSWCLKSGAFYTILDLGDPNLIDLTGLPSQNFYNFNEWDSFLKNRYSVYFKNNGGFIEGISDSFFEEMREHQQALLNKQEGAAYKEYLSNNVVSPSKAFASDTTHIERKQSICFSQFFPAFSSALTINCPISLNESNSLCRNNSNSGIKVGVQ